MGAGYLVFRTFKIDEENSRLQEIISKKDNEIADLSAKNSGSAEAVPLSQEMPLASVTVPVIINSLMSLMVLYSILAFLLIAVIWFVVRKYWNSSKKNNTDYSPNWNYFLSSLGISKTELYDWKLEVQR